MKKWLAIAVVVLALTPTNSRAEPVVIVTIGVPAWVAWVGIGGGAFFLATKLYEAFVEDESEQPSKTSTGRGGVGHGGPRGVQQILL